MKKVCIVGAGAIGGLIGAELAASGRAEVSAMARGATLSALQKHGWRLQTAEGLVQAPVRAAQSAAELGTQDLVFIAVKGPALAQVAPEMALQSLDPGGAIARTLPMPRVVGAVVHASAATLEPGVVSHKMGRGLIIGEPSGGSSERCEQIADLLRCAQFDVTHSEHIRIDIWYKLWGNLTMNPVSALTGATIDRVLADPLVRAFCSVAMEEAAEIGRRIGCPIDQTPEDRHRVTAQLGVFKSSMLQDVEAQRPIELDSIVSAVREMGQRLGIATPNIDALLGLTRLFGRMRGLYPEATQ